MENTTGFIIRSLKEMIQSKQPETRYEVGDLVKNLKIDSPRYSELGIIMKIIQSSQRKYYRVLQKKEEEWLCIGEMEKL